MDIYLTSLLLQLEAASGSEEQAKMILEELQEVRDLLLHVKNLN